MIRFNWSANISATRLCTYLDSVRIIIASEREKKRPHKNPGSPVPVAHMDHRLTENWLERECDFYRWIYSGSAIKIERRASKHLYVSIHASDIFICNLCFYFFCFSFRFGFISFQPQSVCWYFHHLQFRCARRVAATRTTVLPFSGSRGRYSAALFGSNGWKNRKKLNGSFHFNFYH